jgi:hypothetical protein
MIGMQQNMLATIAEKIMCLECKFMHDATGVGVEGITALFSFDHELIKTMIEP